MELKPGYKQTEVGVIPDDWGVCDLQDVVALQRGHDLTWRERRPGIYPVMGSAGQNGFHNVAIAKGPGVILGRSGASFGQAHYCDDDFWPHNTAMFVTDFIGNDRRFIFYFLRAFDFSRHNSGGAQQSLNRNFIARIKVPIPPLPEQKAIAKALSDMDALLSGLDDLIAKKRDIKQATMQQLLTGKTRLPGFTGDWEVKRLGDVAILRSGYSFRSEDYSLLGNFKIVTIANVQSGYMTLEGCQSVFGLPTDLQSHQRLNVGDILISMTGNVGRVCRVTEPDCLLNQRVGKILHVGIDEDFLFTLLGQQSFLEEMTKKAKGGAQPNLSNADITEYRIRIPNDYSEQQAIATVLSDIDDELAALGQRREKTRELKQAMMQDLLTGRTRLV